MKLSLTQIRMIQRNPIVIMTNYLNVTTSISSRQVNLGNNDVKKDQHKHKSKTKKRNEKGRSVTVVVGDSIVKKVKGWELSTKDDLFVVRSFPGAKT